MLTNGQFQVTVAGTPGQRYEMLYSTNLLSTSWVSLASKTLSGTSTNFTDVGASNWHRYYRALLLPQ